ncbi:MAG: hypothetical protein ACOY0T_37660 [Myxococcota bacterium]
MRRRANLSATSEDVDEAAQDVFIPFGLRDAGGLGVAGGCADSYRTCERLRTCVVPEGGAASGGFPESGAPGAGGGTAGGGTSSNGGATIERGGSGFGGNDGGEGGCLDVICSEGGRASMGAGGSAPGGSGGAQEGRAAGAMGRQHMDGQQWKIAT